MDATPAELARHVHQAPWAMCNVRLAEPSVSVNHVDDLRSPATREMGANGCVLDATKGSDVPLAGLRAYCQCTVEEMAKHYPCKK